MNNGVNIVCECELIDWSGENGTLLSGGFFPSFIKPMFILYIYCLQK